MFFWAGDNIPGPQVVYQKNESRVLNRRSKKENITLRYIRGASHDAAIKRLRNLGLFPVSVSPEDSPTGKLWNNFAQVLYTYFIHYCAAEGLTTSHDVTRSVLLYLFYGYFTCGVSGRNYPVLRSIHLQATNGRRRCASFVLPAFGKLFKLLDEHEELVDLLTDDGKAKAPASYMAAVEEGLMEMARASIHTMGSSALKSPHKWKSVLQW